MVQENWKYFYGDGRRRYILEKGDNPEKLEYIDFPAPPPWRQFLNIDKLKDDSEEKKEIKERWLKIQELAKLPENEQSLKKGKNFRIPIEDTQEDEDEIIDAGQEVINAVNAALYLRRPLLLTGNPGSGKTSLAYAIAYELQLAPVLTWPITARSTLQDGLYRYDAIARLQDKEDKPIGDYITLGTLGTAFLPSPLPRVLLIDEIDKSDINLPNDLLHLFEEGTFRIPELTRRAEDAQTEEVEVFTADEGIKATIHRGRVRCAAFPIVIMTSNGEREFPPAFLRRCVRVKMPDPDVKSLESIVEAHFGENTLYNDFKAEISQLIEDFVGEDERVTDRATDQLLNIIHLCLNGITTDTLNKDKLKELLFKPLSISDDL